MRRTLRVIAWIAASVVASVALLFAAFLVWNGRHLHELEASSQVVTTVRGDVEYAVEGNGIPYLSLHGSPGRCIALVMLAPAFRHERLPDGPPTPHPLLWRVQDFGIWSLTLNDRLAGVVVKDLNRRDGAQTVFFRAVMRALIPFNRRFDGARNDVVQRLDPAIDRWPVAAISVPTLVLHGTADENSSYQDSAVLVSKIRQAELVTIPDADHFMPITHAREIQAHIRRFVRERGAR